MARKKPKNHVVSLWSGIHNVGVLSTTDEEFLQVLKQWAIKKGYRVEENESDEG